MTENQCQTRSMPDIRRGAFTLIELLVVIAIIAMLMAIMLPSLNMAKEVARSVKCRANLRQAGIAMITYSSTYNDWLAGPDTSGADFRFGYTPSWIDNSRSGPVQNMDWISPILGEELGLPEERAERFLAICNTDMRCPSNPQKYDGEYPDSGGLLGTDRVKQCYIQSYGASLAFHVRSSKTQSNGYGPGQYVTDQDLRFQVSGSHIPKMSRIKRPSEKVMAMDGTRYISAGQATMNAFEWQDEGGNYMVEGPPMNHSGTPFKLSENPLYTHDPQVTPDARKFAYRHKEKINTVLFDGHVQTLDLEESLDVRLYWPSGSVVKEASKTYDPDDYDGMVIK